MNCEDTAWLVSSEATAWLAEAADEVATSALLKRLRKQLSNARAALIVEQVELRKRAEAKFGAAAKMFFTRKGLEQATDERTARFKADRMRNQIGHEGLVADLCCGIGGDAIALAEHFQQVVGVDHDEVLATLATANFSANQCSNASTQSLDVADFPVAEAIAWHIDPDRRSAGRRTSQWEFGSPSVDVMRKLADANPNGSVKLAPAAEIDDEWSSRGERQWLGDRRSCRQQMLWMGELARSNGAEQGAVVLSPESADEFWGEADAEIDWAVSVGRYIFEPYSPIFAANLQNALAASLGASGLASGVGYFTSNEPIDSPFGACFEVLAEMTYREKKVKAALRERNVGRLEVKKRGVDIDPAKLQKQLQGKDPEQATLILAPLGGKVLALITRRCDL